MKKQIMLFIVALAFILTITGSVSAGPITNTTSIQYQIGQQVTQQALADTTLNMNQADKNLLITTASTAHLNGTTTEDSLQAVVDKTSTLTDGQKITYGSGNLLVIDDPDGLLWYTFISQTGDTLMAKKFTISQSGTITASKTVNIGTTQTSANFQKAITTLGSNGYNTAAIANLWANGAPADLLATTYTAGTVNQGSMINYAIIKQFQQNYPSATVGNDSWTAVTSNYIFTNPGNSGIDAAIYGEYGFAYYYYVMNGGDPSKIAIMQYNEDSKTGLIAVIRENNLRNSYGSVVSGTLSEIKFNNWLFNNYLNNPTNLNKLYSVIMLKKIDETAYKYLWFDSELGYGHGLDEEYIAQLQDLDGSFDQSHIVVPITDIEGMKQLGIDAFNQAQTALKYSNTEDFINDIKSGTVGVISLPYYYNVMINGKSTSLAGFMDGINNASIFSVHNLMTASSHVVWGWDSVQALFLHVTKLDLSNASNTVIESTLTTSINTNPTDLLSNWGGVKGMKAAWAQQEPYDYMMTLSRVGCRCSAQDYYSAMWGIEKYPLSPNEHYMIMSLSGFSQLDSARTTIFGVSPSQGTYLTPGETNDASAMYILIKWNSITNTGIAALIKYDSAISKAIMQNDGYTNSYNWFLDKVLKNTAYLKSAFSVAREIPLTPDSLAALTSAGVNPVNYVSNYTSPTASTDISSGTYNADQTITITTNPGTTIYYTLDGTTPTLTSTVYTAPISITKNTALKYIAVDPTGYISSVYTQNYIIEKPDNPNNPTNPTNPTNPGENNPGTPTTVSAATETTPATTETGTTGQTNPTSTPTATPTSTSSNIPIGAIVGVIILAIAAVLIYLARDTITATIKGTEKPGK